MDNVPRRDKDLHYLVTRIINPVLNSVIASLYENKFIRYRDGSLDVNEYSIPTLMAKFLEDWRDGLWYTYSNKNLTEISEELIMEYISVIKHVYSRIYTTDKKLAEEVGDELILLGRRIEKYLTEKIEFFSNFTFDTSKEESSQFSVNLGEESIVTGEAKIEEEVRVGVCPRCAVYEGDKRKKKLYRCPYCGEWFCERHVEPSLILTFGKYRELWNKYKDLREFLDQEWHKEGGHPCHPYTQKFWEDYENKRRAVVGIRTKKSVRGQIIKDVSPVKEASTPGTFTLHSSYTKTFRGEEWGEDSTIIKIRKSKITRPGRFYKDEYGWISIVVYGSSLRAYVPSSRVRIYEEDDKTVLEIDKITEEDMRNFDLKARGRAAEVVSSMSLKNASKSHGKNQKKRYILPVIAILLLVLAGYLYSQGSFHGMGIFPQGVSPNGSLQGTTTYMSGHTYTEIDKTSTETSTLQSETSTVPITSSSLTSGTDCSKGYWRYIFVDALKCALSPEELSKVSSLAEELKGSTIQESSWNILTWLDENIRYNYSKASLPAPLIWTLNGKITGVTAVHGVEIQTPYETIRRGAGICSDYAILTTALLLEMNYSPVYVFDIAFNNSEVGHVATAIKINGEYFILDQHPPIMDLKTYYEYWSEYGSTIDGKALFISNATVYEIRKNGGTIEVRKIGVLAANDFKS